VRVKVRECVPLNFGVHERHVVIEIGVHGDHWELVLREQLVRFDDLLADTKHR
jgi:hypothetical protein